jgi:hypothetical protein
MENEVAEEEKNEENALTEEDLEYGKWAVDWLAFAVDNLK